MPTQATANNMMASNTNGASSGAAPWFAGAPLTKLLVWLWILVFVLQRHHYKHTEQEQEEEGVYDNTNHYHQLPILLQFLAFDTTGDLVMGLGYLALQLRRLEREISSVQFAEYCLLLIPVSCVIHQTLLVVFGTSSQEQHSVWNYLPPLPPLLIAASLHWYSYYTPRLYPNFISVVGDLKFSEKALQQLWGIYLLLHSHNLSSENTDELWWVASNFGTTTLSYILSGTLSSTLYFYVCSTNSSSQDALVTVLPDWLVNKLPLESMSGWLLVDPPARIFAPALSGRGVPTAARRAPAVAPVAAPPAPIEPSPEAVAQLVAMGFDPDQVTAALRQTNNNVERAADRLLMGS